MGDVRRRHNGTTGEDISPKAGELIIARGSYHGRPFLNVGIIQDVSQRQRFVSTDGIKCPWSHVSMWDYLSDVLPQYDIWKAKGA